jgi:hypothetical protein
MAAPRSADFEGLLRAFHERGIRHVVIGGVSAALQGVPAVTYDLDLVLDPDPANLDTAFELLGELDACFREHLPAKRLAPARSDLSSPGAKLLMTRLGPLDILGELRNGWRHSDLVARTHELVLAEDLRVRALDLVSLIELKEAVGREKDRAVLPLYRRALREREGPSADDRGQ